MKPSAIKKGRIYVFKSGVLRKLESIDEDRAYYRIVGRDGEQQELKTCKLSHFALHALARAIN